ncbi:MAG: hypothetical protein IJ758_01700 [Clostridia bacterium]|nr:hypothetical protein [Clostridia bacterium]
MKLFNKTLSSLVIIFFTFNHLCLGLENKQLLQNNLNNLPQKTTKREMQILQKKNNRKSNVPKPRIKKSSMQINKKVKGFVFCYGIPFLKRILDGIIDYAIASIIGKIIEYKEKYTTGIFEKSI